jgi:metal-responsive CopG/Arc/MetJ family transcriptional regulator
VGVNQQKKKRSCTAEHGSRRRILFLVSDAYRADLKQRFLTTSHHVNKVSVAFIHVMIQYNEMNGTGCGSWCESYVQAVAPTGVM